MSRSPPQKPGTQHGTRRLTRLGLVLCWVVGAEFAYAAVANGVLASGAVQRFVNASETAHLEFARAYTLIPGFVHVEGLQLSYEDHNMQFAFDFDEANLIVHLPWLLKRRFSASRVHVSGLRFLFRHKVSQVAGHEAALARYPTIPNVADPPLLQQPKPSDRDKLWSFELRGVDAQIRELWFMSYRYLGPARATGGFQLIPYENLDVGPARLTLQSGRLHNGKQQLLSADAQGVIDLYLEPVNPETLTGMTAFDPISTTVRLDMHTENIDPVNLYLADPSVTQVSGGGGTLHVDAKMEHAKLTSGNIHYTMREPVRIAHEPIAVEAAVTLDLGVTPSDVDRKSRIDLILDTEQVTLSALAPRRERSSPSSEPANLAVADRVHGAIEFRELDLTQDFQPLRTSFDVPRISSDHLQRLDPLIPGKRKWHVLGGRVDAEISYQSQQGITHAGIDGHFDALHLQLKEQQLQGYGKLHVRYRADHQSSRLDDSEVLFNTLITQSGNLHTDDWWASLSASRLQLTGPKGPALDGTIVVRAKNPDPVRQALHIPGIAKLVIPDKPVEVVLRLEQHNDSRRLQLLQAKTGSLTVAGELWSGASGECGAFRVDGIPVPVGISLQGDDSELTWFASEGWLAAHLRDLGCRPPMANQAQPHSDGKAADRRADGNQ
ncbi:MAG TPA: hypothetical protein VL137_13040 [Polyangiaceae bacterium]|nr:hypothetical protein [Polyangiaceae bacterium]